MENVPTNGPGQQVRHQFLRTLLDCPAMICSHLSFWSALIHLRGLRSVSLIKGIGQLPRLRLLWVDAVCITQDDLKWRSRQVSMMKTIYRQTTAVVVWLGPATDNSDTASEFI